MGGTRPVVLFAEKVGKAAACAGALAQPPLGKRRRGVDGRLAAPLRLAAPPLRRQGRAGHAGGDFPADGQAHRGEHARLHQAAQVSAPRRAGLATPAICWVPRPRCSLQCAAVHADTCTHTHTGVLQCIDGGFFMQRRLRSGGLPPHPRPVPRLLVRTHAQLHPCLPQLLCSEREQPALPQPLPAAPAPRRQEAGRAGR